MVWMVPITTGVSVIDLFVHGRAGDPYWGILTTQTGVYHDFA